MVKIVNVDAAAAWDGDDGDDWSREWQRYDRAVAWYHRALLDRAAIGRGEAVLDVGCGNGETTRDAARAAGEHGRALGVDLSSRMLERARALAAQEHVTNASFEQADAQVHDFGPGVFDVVLSRFGMMFFADRRAAFANVARSMRSGGRLALAAWQDVEHNEWIKAVRVALAVGRVLPSPPPGGPGPLGLADPDGVRAMLQQAGLHDVGIEPLDGPFWVGSDTHDAFEFVRGTGMVRGMLQGLDDRQRSSALGALRDSIAAHQTDDGVVFGSGVLVITARKP